MEDDNAQTKDSVVSLLMLRIASVALAAIMLVIVSDVLLRFVFNTPVKGAYDVVTIGLLVMVFFGIASVIERGSEIMIDLVDAFLPAGVIRVLALVSAIATIVMFLFLGWSMIAPAQDAWRWGGYSLELGVPNWAVWVVAFVGLAGIVWVAIAKGVRVARGEDPRSKRQAESEEQVL